MRKQAKPVRVAVVMAAYNEANLIQKVVRTIPSELPSVQADVQVVVVDDGSVDATYNEAREAGATVLRHLINRGQGAALKTGIDYALLTGADVVVTFDADGQHDASEIEGLVQTLLGNNYDVVLGSRFLGKQPRNIPKLRWFILKVGVLFTRLISRVKVSDTHNGFRAFRALALQQIKMVQDRMEHASEIIDQVGRLRLRYTEVPVTISYSGYSKLKGQRSSNALRIAGKMIMHKIIR